MTISPALLLRADEVIERTAARSSRCSAARQSHGRSRRARSRQPLPVIGYLEHRSAETTADRLRGFRQGLKETGYVEGENVAIAYRWGEYQFDRLPQLTAELVHRQVAVITAVAIAIVARSLRSIDPSWPKAASNAADMLGCLLAQTNDRRARAARKQLRLALCERRRAGFARLSGWQPVGNWVASAANFPASLLPVGVTPTTSRRIATRDLRRKWPEAQAERVASVHVFGSQKGQKPSPAACVTIR